MSVRIKHSCLFCKDIIVFGGTSKKWLECLNEDFKCGHWRDYCLLVGIPIPLFSFTAWGKFYMQLSMMRRVWLRYKVYVDRRQETDIDLPYSNSLGICDLSILNAPIEMRLHKSLPEWIKDAIQELCRFFGTLPCDYLASLILIYQIETFALGDIILLDDGEPILRDPCINVRTGVCAIGIGYVVPNGFGGHVLGIHYDINELVLAFRVNENCETEFVRYVVVCYDAIENNERALLGHSSAAAFIADQVHVIKDMRMYDGFLNITIDVYKSFAELVSSCTHQISSGVIRQRTSESTTCFTPSFLLWNGVEDPEDFDRGVF